MLALINDDMAQFELKGLTTIGVTLGIACGIVSASILSSYFIKCLEHLKHKK